MFLLPVALLCSTLSLAPLTNAQSYSATYLPTNAPNQTEQGQTGTNQCGTGFSQTSSCQNAYLNAVDDFCLFAPPDTGPDSVIGNTERIEVAWCLKPGTGSRLIPDGAITGVHLVQTPDYVQITGVGDLTKLNIPAGDGGGELDPHGADGNGNPIGGLVFSSAFGSLVQMHEWTQFISSGEFCFRACKDGPNAPKLCQHIYDVMGCFWNMPGNYDPGVFETCKGDTGEPMGIYGTSTFFQGQPNTPRPHPAPSSSLCTTLSTVGNGFEITGTSIVSSSPTSATTATSVTTTGSATTGTTGTARSTQATNSGSTKSSATAAAATSGNTSAGHCSAPVDWKHSLLGVGSVVLGCLAGAGLVF